MRKNLHKMKENRRGTPVTILQALVANKENYNKELIDYYKLCERG